jgi:hypothetical protein
MTTTSYAVQRMAETRWAGHGDWPEGHRQCMKCEQVKPNEAFHKHAKCKGGYNSVCKLCRKPLSQAQYRTITKERLLWDAAKSRAKAKGRDFNIEVTDISIPSVCPVLNIPMDSPSLDRIDSSKGYVKGNVRVISVRANMLKNDATIEELEMVLADAKRLRGVCEIL